MKHAPALTQTFTHRFLWNAIFSVATFDPRRLKISIDFKLVDSIAILTLNNPKGGNAIDMAFADALVNLAIRCDTDPAIRCVVLTGSGRLFSAGGDLTAFGDAAPNTPAFINELAGKLHMALFRLLRMRKPFIVLVNGPAAGAGLSLVLAGDVTLAVPEAHFTTAYMQVGLSPDGGMTWLLPRMVGIRKAQDMIINNRRVGAQEAEQIGLITRVVDTDKLMEDGMALAKQLANGPTDAIGSARNLLLDAFNGPMEGHLERETQMITRAAGTEDCNEAVKAFLEKRNPNFIGH